MLRQSFAYFAMFGLVVAPTGAPLAQSERRATSLEEVVVTAQKREESLQDAPISLSVFGEDALQDIGVSEFGQVAEFTPNLSIRKQPSSMDNYGIGIRGVVHGETSILVDPRVGVYIDGIYLGRATGMAFDINDMERIEVLRGPQGTLYGRNTIGGAINIITAQPDGEFNFKQKLSMGQGGLLESRTSVELDAVDMGAYGRLLSSFTYLLNEHDGLIENSADGRLLGESEAEGLRVALRWEYSDALTVDYRYDMSERDNYPDVSQITHVRGSRQLGGPISLALAEAADSDRRSVISKYVGRGSANDGSYSEIEGHSIVVEWDTGAWGTLKSITGLREWDSGTDTTDFGSWQFSGDDLNKIWMVGLDNNMMPALVNPTAERGSEGFSVFSSNRTSEQEQFSQEFQLVGDMMNGDLEYTLGVFFFEEESSEINPQRNTLTGIAAVNVPSIATLIPPEWGTAMVADPDDPTMMIPNPDRGEGHDFWTESPNFYYGQDVESQGLYGQVRWRMSDRSHWTFGLRYTEESKDGFLENAGPGPAEGAMACQGPHGRNEAPDSQCARVEDDNSWDNFQGFVNFSYDLSDYMHLYLTASSGYGSGGYNGRAELSSFNMPYDEETLENLEIGWKYQSDDNRTRFNGATFLMQYKDRQIAQFEAGSAGASSNITNAGEQLQRGVEFELTRIINEGLRMSLTYSYLDVDFESFVTTVQDPVSGVTQRSLGNVDLATSDDWSAKAPHAPKHTASFQLNYDFETLPIGDLSFWLGASYSTNIVYHPQLNLYDATGEYMLINLRLTLDVETGGAVPGDLQASFWAKNIRDKEVRGWGIDFGGLGFAVNTYEDVGSLGFDLVWNY